MQPLIPIENSSNLAGWAFDSATGVMAIAFKSDERPHLYRDAPPHKVEGFKAAVSKGRFLIAEIRDQHDHESPDGTVTPAAKRTAGETT
jgi:hypothetical protein